jgi:hypothetical protein
MLYAWGVMMFVIKLGSSGVLFGTAVTFVDFKKYGKFG